MAESKLSSLRAFTMKMEKLVNTIAIALLLGLVGAAFMVMNYTAESNLVTANVATIQAKNKSKVLQQVGLLTAEVKMLQKDLERVREVLEKGQSSKKD